MSALLKLLSDVLHVAEALVHWRLSVSLLAGIAIASVLWAVISNEVIGAILWLVLVAVATIAGVIWDRKTHEGWMAEGCS